MQGKIDITLCIAHATADKDEAMGGGEHQCNASERISVSERTLADALFAAIQSLNFAHFGNTTALFVDFNSALLKSTKRYMIFVNFSPMAIVSCGGCLCGGCRTIQFFY